MQIKHHDTDQSVLIVAEIGNNHEGSLDVARQLVHRAREAQVDAVKFQTFQADQFVRRADSARMARMKQFELAQDEFAELQDLAHSLGLLFLSTPLDLESARFLAPLVDGFKIASGDNNFYPLLRVVGQSMKPVIISTGASDLQQIQTCKQFLEQQWESTGASCELAILHCVSNYPVAPLDANLKAIETIHQHVGGTVGYSDHTLGIQACMLAVALGARIVEKHFTLDHNYSDFRDHQLSADPQQMAQLVEQVRAASSMMGDGNKGLFEHEVDMAHAIRRSIVAIRDLPSGHTICSQDLTWLRPADGLAPGNEDQLIGLQIRRPLMQGEPIQLSDVA